MTGITDSAQQIIDAIRAYPPGALKSFRTPETDIDISISLENFDAVKARFKHAMSAGCFLEAISLRLLYIEELLKLFVFNAQPVGKKPEKMLGSLITQCVGLGFDPALAQRLRDFNAARVDGIHKFLMGKTTYEKMEQALTSSNGVAADTLRFVLLNSGTPLTEQLFMEWNSVGDRVMHIEGMIHSIQDDAI